MSEKQHCEGGASSPSCWSAAEGSSVESSSAVPSAATASGDESEVTRPGDALDLLTAATCKASTSSRPSSATTSTCSGSSRPASNTSRPTSGSTTSRPSSSGTSRPTSLPGGGATRSECSSSGYSTGASTTRQESHSRTSSLSSGDGLLLSVSALARGGVRGGDTAAGGECMGQSGTRQAGGGGGDTPSGPPSGEREDPEGLTDGEDEVQSGLGSLLAVDKRVFGRLQEELTAAQSELRLKEEEVTRLSRIRDEVESELQELTASLFQEAHNMVREANVKAAQSEKALVESNMKVDGLMMEVAALKALVITSTPAKPNPHLHPQISGGKSSTLPGARGGGGGGSAPGTPTKERLVVGGEETDGEMEVKEEKFMDPVLRGELMEWKKFPKMDPASPFFVRIYREDITPCLEFPNTTLSLQIREAVQQNTICISPVKESMELPRNCELLEQPRRCTHVISLGEGDSSQHFVSQLARNRIAAVCDFLIYCRYITQGLVKQHVNEVYWQIINRRRNMTLARLGYSPES